MKTKTIFQTKAVTGNTPQETALLFNQTMQELADLNPTYERDGNTFWIFYTVTQQEPETIKDVCELDGEKATCYDCPYIMRDLNRYGNIDTRKRWATCGKTGERTHIESSACDEYYRLERRKK